MSLDIRQPNRAAPPWRQILTPIWCPWRVVAWLMADDHRNTRWSWLHWSLRNPVYNLAATVLGIAHRQRAVTCRRGPGWTWAPLGGWNWGASLPMGSLIARPFLSHRGSTWEWMIGWKTSGVLSITCRRSCSPNATEEE
jgi:hypothetical protein